ncbi:MAG: sulfopyruvate decarboxylase subunit alpha [Deltaproteobacteria bacterium]|nr:sulfopyruvate decarboxylase subunit alpha [Deltaproteobacteria bacterium]
MSAPSSNARFAGADFAASLRAAGFDFFTGVPCSLIASVLRALEADGYVPETREDAALGLAAGAALAGKRPVVLMQNSGFGVSLNALGSLQQIYEMPCLLVITWRGQGGTDAPEHLVMGRVMPTILDAYQIPWRTLGERELDADVAWARERFDETGRPVALVVPPGVFA